MTDPSVIARGRALYERGATTVFACRMDPRFSYCLYVPGSFDRRPAEHALIVAVHGSARTMTEFRDAFADMAEAHSCIVLAPLFPVGAAGDDNAEGFKYLVEGAIRYDLVLLAMVAEAGARLGTTFDRFCLFGFSGGAQFVNRFLLLHPRHLWGVSIAAPGSVTLLDARRDYWVGTRDLSERFNHAFDVEAVKNIAVQLVVGQSDTETWEIHYTQGRAGYMDGINDSGDTRIARSAALHENFLAHGVASRLDIVPEVAHEWRPLLPAIKAFCLTALTSWRERGMV